MAVNNTILLKKSTTGGTAQLSGLQYGELAINYSDTDTNGGRLFYKDSNNVVRWFATDGQGTVKLSSILAATAANTIANGDNAQVWNWAVSTASKSAFKLGESAASTGSGATLLEIATLAASTARPLLVSAQGQQAIKVDADGTTTVGRSGSVGGYVVVGGTTGSVTVAGLDGSGSGVGGAAVSVQAGNGVAGVGGALQLLAGNGVGGAGGQVDITAGSANLTGGGAVVITTGSGTAANANAGNFTVQLGTKNGTGAAGTALINVNDGKFQVQSTGGVGFKVDANANVFAGLAGSTTATNGYFFLPSVTGTPTGVPAALVSGFAPIVYDSTADKMWAYDTDTSSWKAAGGGGTVTSVALTTPSFLTVAGSPITTSGTLAVTLASQSANTVFAAPNGSAGAPTFRNLVIGDFGPAFVLQPANGGTGVANTNTITLGGDVVTGGALTTAGNFTTSGAFPLTLTTTGATNVTLPTSGTLVTTQTAVTSVTGTANRVSVSSTVSGGKGDVTLDISSTYAGQSSIVTVGTITTGTWQGSVVAPAFGGTGVNNGTKTITLGGDVSTAGALTFAGAFPVDFTATGATSLTLPTSGTLLVNSNIGTSVQAWDAGLDALAAKTSTGILVQTGNDTYVSRSLVAPSAGFTISNADGVSGNPTFALANDLAALEGLTTTGYIVRTGDGTATTRAITGSAGNIVVTNGSGVSSDTTVNLATVTQANTGNFVKVTLDGYGRVTGNTAVTTADITALVDTTYVNVTGDTMSGNLTFSGGSTVTGLPTPTNDSDAANKAYVDNSVTGLSWKQAVRVATTANGTLATAFAAGQVVDGVTLVAGDRVLIKNQTAGAENGIYVVQASGTPVRATDADTGAELRGASVFVEEGTYADSAWVQTTNAPITVGTTALVFNQFSGAGAYSGGVGINVSGTTISVKLGAGIAQLPTNEVGVDLYNSTTGAIILTTDGTTRTTASAAQLHLLLPAGSGLTQDATGLYIPAAGVTNAMLTNSSITINGDSGTPDPVSLGESFQIIGTSAQGISTAVTNNVLTITAANASAAQKGVASFNTASFLVTAGDVTIKTAGVSNAQLANSTFTLTGTTGSDAVALGETVQFVGGTTPITTSVASNTVTINVADATVSSKGLASFDTNYFTVTSGAVSWNNNAALTVSSLTDTGLTTNSFIYSSTGGLLASTTAATDGQLLIGSTGNAPVKATLTGTANRLTVTNGAGSITLDISAAYVGQTSITTLGTVTTGTWNATTIGTTYGGTGLSSYTTGDTLYASATNTLAKLSIGTTGQALVVAGGVPTWANVANSVSLNTSGTAAGNVFTTVPTTGTSGDVALTIAFKTQVKNTILAGPVTGANAAPTFRAISLANGDVADVDTTTSAPADGYLLAWKASTSKWEPTNTIDGGAF